MSGKLARLLFLGSCVVLAVLLLTRVITPLAGCSVFAAVLVLLGLLSGGFRKEGRSG